MTDAARHEENVARGAIVRVGKSLFERGMTFGATGNISVRLAGDGWLMHHAISSPIMAP
jgi:ribulose-5-phosphate 4-epimerase/fuculose-1-phosphate aldolase